MTKNRLLELVVSFCIYSLIIVVCCNIIFSIDLESKLKTIRDRNNAIYEYLE